MNLWNILQAFWKQKGFSGEIVARPSERCPFGATFDASSPSGSPALVGFIAGAQACYWNSREVRDWQTEWIQGENVRAMVWERAEMAQCQEQCWGILGTVPEVCSFTRFRAIEEYLHEEVKIDALAAVGCQEPFPVGRLSTGLVYAVRVFLKRVKLICPFITPFFRPRHLRHKHTRLR